MKIRGRSQRVSPLISAADLQQKNALTEQDIIANTLRFAMSSQRTRTSTMREWFSFLELSPLLYTMLTAGQK